MMLLQVKDLISSSGLKKLCARFYHTPNILLSRTKYRASTQLCSNTIKKKRIESVYFSEGK